LISFKVVPSDDRNTLKVFTNVDESFADSEEAKQLLVLREVKNKNKNRTGPKRVEPFIVAGSRTLAVEAGVPVHG